MAEISGSPLSPHTPVHTTPEPPRTTRSLIRRFWEWVSGRTSSVATSSPPIEHVAVAQAETATATERAVERAATLPLHMRGRHREFIQMAGQDSRGITEIAATQLHSPHWLESDESVELLRPGVLPKAVPTPQDARLGWSQTRGIPLFSERVILDGHDMGREQIQGIPTKESLKASVAYRRSILQKQLDATPLAQTEERQRLSECIRADDRMLITLNRSQECLHATGVRETVMKSGKPISDFAYGEVPDLVRNSFSVAGDGEFSLVQFGALSDQRNTLVSYTTLVAAVEGHGAQQTQALLEIAKTRQMLQHELSRSPLADTKRAVIEHALDELDEAHLRQTLVSHREILQHQFLCIVQAHMEEAARAGAVLTTFHMAHTSLLNPQTKRWETMGLFHDEEHMIETMSQLFHEFDGAVIVLETPDDAAPETKFPFIDMEGVIHFPRPTGVPPSIDRITLRPHFANASVERQNRVGTQCQLAANTLCLAEMRQRVEELKKHTPPMSAVLSALRTPDANIALLRRAYHRAEKIERAEKLLAQAEKGLSAGRGSYDIATALIEAQKLLGWRVSTGCFSNKDRGGIAGCKLTMEMASHEKMASASFEEALVLAYRNRATVLSGQGRRDEALKQIGLALVAGSTAARLRREAQEIAHTSYRSLKADSIQLAFANWAVQTRQIAIKGWPGVLSLFSHQALTIIGSLIRLARSVFLKSSS